MAIGWASDLVASDRANPQSWQRHVEEFLSEQHGRSWSPDECKMPRLFLGALSGQVTLDPAGDFPDERESYGVPRFRPPED